MGSPTQKTIKQLFALSRNQCAFPHCTLPIIEPATNVVIGEVCHVKARSPGGPRYDETQSEEQRHGFANLLLMCSVHAKVIDEDAESYTVERLTQIKQEHESATGTAENTSERFRQLLDERIRLILQHEEDRAKSTENQNSGPFALAQQMAKKRLYQERRGKWRASPEGLDAAITSINEVFQGVSQRYNEEIQTLTTLEVQLHTEEKYRVIGTRYLGCQFELKGWDRADHYTIPDNLAIEMMLFGKDPHPTSSQHFYTKPIERRVFKPDVDEDMRTVWRDERGNRLTSDQMVDLLFETFFKELQKGRPRPGGRYQVGDEIVDAWGNPIRSSESPDDDWY